ncbi:MAG: hypothetical protein M4579_006519 [Chaenotheca gracillima]|nr:MAG: hypothetical protein M4579_006519 [Chaenotheca gracillima]
MSATSSAVPTSTNLLDGPAGKGQSDQGISISSFLASLAVAAAVFAVELLAFIILQNRIRKIYLPKTFLVPEKELTPPPPPGLLGWVIPIFKTTTSDFIEKCGLDAYFFLRFLRTLLKIFIPLSIVILPVLLPLNYHSGRGDAYAIGPRINEKNVTGLDQLGWGNVRPEDTNRYWAHFILAVFVVVYVCYTFFDELRGYVRMRQAYLTSPQHRLRASATTVLVSSIPRKWLSVEALDGLYDVFPGGIRNIWINRDFDELAEKVKKRNKIAMKLESAETDLIKKAKAANDEKLAKEAKKAGNKQSKAEKAQKAKDADAHASRIADGPGVSSGDPHQVKHNLHDAAHEDDAASTTSSRSGRKKNFIPIPIVGQGLGAVGHGVGQLGQTVLGGFKRVGKGFDDRLNTTQGFVADEDNSHVIVDRHDQIGDGVAPGYHVDSQSRTVPDAGATVRTVDGVERGPASLSVDRTRSNESTVRPSGSDDSGARIVAQKDTLTSPSAPYSGDVDPRVDTDITTKPHTALQADSQKPGWKIWSKDKSKDRALSPRPAGYTDEDVAADAERSGTKLNPLKVIGLQKEGDTKEGQEYPSAYNDIEEDDSTPAWKDHLKDSDRDTMRLPVYGKEWMPSLPLMGQKVDTIDYCRRELARLNVEIEQDQQHPENFPLMNSAFVQFHHQVAAHMACQTVSHHLPKQMAPRTVEISPMDVVWDNMSMKWWERYLRTGVVLIVVIALIVGWAIPVSFTGLLSQLGYLANTYSWLTWINKLPVWLLSVIQGVLPQVLLGLLMVLLPFILRALAKQSGIVTGMGIELSVQRYFFAFSFVQLFLIVSISSGIFSVISQILQDPQGTPSLLASNLPKASNYFFSYMLLQAFSVSAGALVQIGSLITWFVLAPLMDNTARKKWRRTTKLPKMKWGTFFPVYANLACIGIIYSIISPLIMLFNIITFSLFWVVYRYDTLYVRKFRFDTGGLLYPTAINQLFTGLYVMEICLVGLFFLVRDENNDVACKGQAIAMIVVTALTILYQYLLDEAFSPLYRYLPITLEDDAVARDEEFARAQGKKFGLTQEDDEEDKEDDLDDVLEKRERAERRAESEAEEIEMREISERRRSRLHPLHRIPGAAKVGLGGGSSSADKHASADYAHYPAHPTSPRTHTRDSTSPHPVSAPKPAREPATAKDIESQRRDPIAERLFGGIHDEIEDLTPDERDALVHRAFQHEALRAKRPVIWIPRDDLGISDDEIFRTQRLSKHIWISNEYTGLDAHGRVLYRRSPPDFSEVDMIDL